MMKSDINNLEWRERFSYVKNILFDQKKLNQKGAKFQIVKFLPHSEVGPHYHNKVTEIFFVYEGAGTFTFNGVPCLGQKGSIFLCEPGDRHAIKNDSSQELVILIFKTKEDSRDIVWVEEGSRGVSLP